MTREETITLLKQMAMADGVLSENEKKLFRELVPMSDDEAEALFQTMETELESIQSETEVIDWKKKNGLDFEKFVVSRFPTRFKIIQWTSDKFVEGRYDVHNEDPDVLLEVKSAKHCAKIAIECKFRMGFFNDWVHVAKDYQLERYRKFQAESGYEVFFAIGVGGSGLHPEELYVVPLNVIKYVWAKRSYLAPYQLNVDHKLFYNFEEHAIVNKK